MSSIRRIGPARPAPVEDITSAVARDWNPPAIAAAEASPRMTAGVALGRLDEYLDNLDKRLDSLGSILAPILSNSMPRAATVGTVDAAGTDSPLIETIQASTERVGLALDRLADLLSRVQL